MLVLDRRSGTTMHSVVRELPDLLRSGDLLLLNDTRVIPARLYARRTSGRRFELLLLRPLDETCWQGLLRPSARARVDEPLSLQDGGVVRPLERFGGGEWRLRFEPPLDLPRLEGLGEPPLPPYIERPNGATAADRVAYQTIYAREPGAVAAPTAGLHFTPEMLEDADRRGVEIAALTLHVGLGTFRPVAVEDPARHPMHGERYFVSEAAAAAVNVALQRRRRIVCVGTTSVRALEGGLAAGDGRLRPGWAETDLFITPGYLFRGVGALLTNFHLPRSTLLMLVSALAGQERVLTAYLEAVAEGYRFYSYGDAMFIQ